MTAAASMCHALPGVGRILGATLDTETAGSAFTHNLGLGSALALAVVCKPYPHHNVCGAMSGIYIYITLLSVPYLSENL